MTTLRRILSTSAVLAIAALAPASARADDVLDDAPTSTFASNQECVDPVLSQPFSALGDFRDYVLAPGGEFDDSNGAGWSFSGGARIVQTSQRDGTRGGALYLPYGSTAVSATMCVDLNYPTARTWARNTFGLLGLGQVKVSVVYPDADKDWKVRGGDDVKARGLDWSASSDIKVDPAKGGKDAGWRRVAFVFTSKGDYFVDGFYVDPRMVR